VRDSRGIDGEALFWLPRSGVNTEFASADKDCRGKETSGRYTGREPFGHGEEKTNKRTTQSLS